MRRNRKRLVIWAACIAAALVVVGVSGFVIRKQVLVGEACSASRVLTAQEGAFVHARTGSVHVTVLGDSYSAGDTLANRRDAWVFELPKSSDWDVSVAAIGSTGFTNGGPCGDAAFGKRIEAAVSTHPDILIIQGGLNDWEASAEQVRDAADKVLDRTSAVPRVVLVGPVTAPARDGAATTDRVLSQVAAKHGAQYVSALHWHVQFSAPGLHLTPRGHVEYAAKVAAAIGD